MDMEMSRSLLLRICMCYLLVSTICAESESELEDPSKRGIISTIGCKVFGSGCPKPEDYALLFDAGSSSTKLKVYRVNPGKEGSPLPSLDLQYSERFDPGLGDATDVRSYLVNILSVAKEKVPESRHSSTPIFLLATAGLRFLNATDATNLIDNVRSVFSDSSVSPFIYKAERVGILSGEEEGVYAWVSANYLLGFFNKNSSDKKAVGVLEMGGGSTQITFIPESPLYDGEFQVRVAGKNYELYVHSYLEFGINAINTWVAEVLHGREPEGASLTNPCMLRDDTANVKLDNGHELSFTGTGNPTDCKAVLEQILTPDTGIRCNPKPCAIGSVYQPGVDDIQFYATQGFTYAPKALHVVGEDEILHLGQLEEAAFKHCDRSLSEAAADGISEKQASGTCLMGIYIPTLFTLAYGFPADTGNIKVTSNVGNDTIDWALGALAIQLSGNSVKRR